MAEKVKRLRIYFVTWNVATKYPEQELRQLLDLSHDCVPKTLPDMYFVGLQEVKAQPQNMVLNLIFEDPWTKSFRDILKEHDYVKIRTQRLQGLVLNGFCLRKHVTHVRLMEAQYTRTGFGGMWGNKGAVSIRLNIYGVSICVVNTHLTPHDHLLADRILDYSTILTNHSFSVPDTSKILYHDYIFWIGDLNFRLAGESLTAEDIDLLVKHKQLKYLLDSDQLKLAMESGEAFAELKENAITFPPTYKYEFASQEFDLKRRPSWTDRILYKVNADVYDDVKLCTVQLNYNSHPSYVLSDHKPVTGEFDIVIRGETEDDGIKFEPMSSWFIDRDNYISYKLLGDVKPSDWVGLFPTEFSSLDEYIIYEYVGRGRVPSATLDSLATGRISCTDLSPLGTYCLVYVAQRGNLTGILGISPSFPGIPRQT